MDVGFVGGVGGTVDLVEMVQSSVSAIGAALYTSVLGFLSRKKNGLGALMKN